MDPIPVKFTELLMGCRARSVPAGLSLVPSLLFLEAQWQWLGKKEAQSSHVIEASQTLMCPGSDPHMMFEEWWIDHLPWLTQAAQFCWRKESFTELDNVPWWRHIPPLRSSPACTSHDQQQGGASTLAPWSPWTLLQPASSSLETYTQLHTMQFLVLHHDLGTVLSPAFSSHLQL